METITHPQIEIDRFRMKLIQLAERMLPNPVRGFVILELNTSSDEAILSLRKELQQLL
jgi:hypothetical protein